MKEPPEIENVVRFHNGMVMVFDQYGQQMPEFQGTWEERKDLIRNSIGAHVPIVGPVSFGSVSR